MSYDTTERSGDGLRSQKKHFSPEDIEKIFSRDEVLKCPYSMVLLGYLSRKHNLPKSGWSTPGLRYHYTDAAGLLGIIQSGRLWATDIRFLNDPSEGSFFTQRLFCIMESLPEGRTPKARKVIQDLRQELDKPQGSHEVFCASLSAEGDLLSQWRGYGSFGKGYAIGLKLGGNCPHPQVAGFYDVSYGDEGLHELATDLLSMFVEASDIWGDTMYGEWASVLKAMAKSFKNFSYIEERESRLVCSYFGNDEKFSKELPLYFREKDGDIVPYISMSLSLLIETEEPRLPIERIVVGPGLDYERNSASIKALLEANDYYDVIIEPSIIPFRS